MSRIIPISVDPEFKKMSEARELKTRRSFDGGKVVHEIPVGRTPFSLGFPRRHSEGGKYYRSEATVNGKSHQKISERDIEREFEEEAEKHFGRRIFEKDLIRSDPRFWESTFHSRSRTGDDREGFAVQNKKDKMTLPQNSNDSDAGSSSRMRRDRLDDMDLNFSDPEFDNRNKDINIEIEQSEPNRMKASVGSEETQKGNQSNRQFSCPTSRGEYESVKLPVIINGCEEKENREKTSEANNNDDLQLGENQQDEFIVTIPIELEMGEEQHGLKEREEEDKMTEQSEEGADDKGKLTGHREIRDSTEDHKIIGNESQEFNEKISQIRSLEEELYKLDDKVRSFESAVGSTEYVCLEEMLMRCVIELDKIEANGDEQIRNARKAAVRCAQDTLNELEEKSTRYEHENDNTTGPALSD